MTQTTQQTTKGSTGNTAGNGSTLPPGISPEIWATMPEVARKALVEAHVKNQALQAQLDARPKGQAKVTVRLSAKGGVSVYGLGRFPVTLYASQWESLEGVLPEVMALIKANPDKIARKE